MADTDGSPQQKWTAQTLSNKVAEILETLAEFTSGSNLSHLGDPNVNAPYAMAILTVVSLRDHFVEVYRENEGNDLTEVDETVNTALYQIEMLILRAKNLVAAAMSAST